MRQLTILMIMAVLLIGCGRQEYEQLPPRDTRAEDFVYIDDDHFALNDSIWFPLMVNYKVDWRRHGDTAWITPAYYYDNPDSWDADNLWEARESMERHFYVLNNILEANAVRICLDVVNRDSQGYFYGSADNPIYLIADSSAIFNAIGRMLSSLDGRFEMKAMLLLKPPLDEELMTFTGALLRHFANTPAIFAYDFMNEPLYFDPAHTREKAEALAIVKSWRSLMDSYAPHQLFTIGFAEPIEVFEWDPALLPVDFVEMHTYHPLRVASEMYWYGHYCGKPWMVGETALPADGDSVPYEWQRTFMRESFQCALDNGACGYGWWEYQDCPIGVNFEAQYTGLFNHKKLKPAATEFPTLRQLRRSKAERPINYYNMLGYDNLVVCGKVVDKRGKPIEGALIRGWNEDWSVGMNTYSAPDGTFTLYSNDACTHFEVSAPRCSHMKFDCQPVYSDPQGRPVDINALPCRRREYQSIDYRGFLINDSSLLTFTKDAWQSYVGKTDLGTLKL